MSSWLSSCCGGISLLAVEVHLFSLSAVVFWLLISCYHVTLFTFYESFSIWLCSALLIATHSSHSVCCSVCNCKIYPTREADRQSDLARVGRVLRWQLGMAPVWTRLCSGVQAEPGGQCTLVGQGDTLWNGLANHVWTEVDELAVDHQLETGYTDVAVTVSSTLISMSNE